MTHLLYYVPWDCDGKFYVSTWLGHTMRTCLVRCHYVTVRMCFGGINIWTCSLNTAAAFSDVNGPHPTSWKPKQNKETKEQREFFLPVSRNASFLSELNISTSWVLNQLSDENFHHRLFYKCDINLIHCQTSWISGVTDYRAEISCNHVNQFVINFFM